MSGILKYNLINKNNAVIPNYDISRKEQRIEILFNSDKDVVIIGRIDNNYICWLSKTELDNKEINEQIFNYLAYGKRPELISNEYNIFNGGCSREEWYKVSFLPIKQGESIETPFGHNYSGENRERHGKWFAKDIITFFKRMRERCEYRFCKGKYIDVLENYYSVMCADKSPYYYERITEILEIIESEKYLILAENEKLRNSYIKCLKKSNELYCKYMSAVR